MSFDFGALTSSHCNKNLTSTKSHSMVYGHGQNVSGRQERLVVHGNTCRPDDICVVAGISLRPCLPSTVSRPHKDNSFGCLERVTLWCRFFAVEQNEVSYPEKRGLASRRLSGAWLSSSTQRRALPAPRPLPGLRFRPRQRQVSS